MATYFDVEKKEFCEALETFLKEWFKEDYTGKCAGGTFVGKIGVNKTSHFPTYFTIQVVEKNSEYKERQEAIQKEKKERVQKLLSALTTEEKKELLKAFLDDIQNETEEN